MSLDVTLLVNEEEVFSANITHNLGTMANAAGLYEALWRPEEIGAVYARDIIPIIGSGLGILRSNPDKFRKLESDNGWGLYKHFVPWVESYLKALVENSDAIIEVDR
jgi:hypothetical protein